MPRPKVIRVVSFNTHAGITIRHGAARWIVHRMRPHLIAFQEVRNPAELQRKLGRKWDLAPAQNTAAGTYVAYRRSRFRLDFTTNPVITFGEKRERRLTTAGLYDRRTRRTIVLASVHVAPLGKGFGDAPDGPRRVHKRQVQAYADRLEDVAPDRVAVAAGDFNEVLGTRDRLTPNLRERDAVARFARAGLRFASRQLRRSARLDDVAFRPATFVRLRTWHAQHVPVRGADHPAVAAAFLITPAPKPRR